MADVPFYTAYVSAVDSADKSTHMEMRVDATDAKAYVAAADTAARAATKVGLLLIGMENLALWVIGGTGEVEHGVKSGFKNGSYVPFTVEAEAFRSNKLNVSYSTNNAGVPASGGFTIAIRNPAAYTLESNGVNLDLEDGGDTENLVTQIEDTVLSSYGTAVVVQEITVNDQ